MARRLRRNPAEGCGRSARHRSHIELVRGDCVRAGTIGRKEVREVKGKGTKKSITSAHLTERHANKKFTLKGGGRAKSGPIVRTPFSSVGKK